MSDLNLPFHIHRYRFVGWHCRIVAYSRYGLLFLNDIGLFLTFIPEISSILPFDLADTTGNAHCHWVQHRLLSRHWNDSASETQLALVTWESMDCVFDDFYIREVASPTWLGSVARRCAN